MSLSVTCRSLEQYQVQVSTPTHSWVADEPPAEAGDGLGPNPVELLLGALGACTTITVYHRAAKAGVALENLWVDVEGKSVGEDEEETLHMQVTVRVRGDLSDEDLEQIADFANACHVHRLLKHGSPIEVEVQAV
jgi:putative redox protein